MVWTTQYSLTCVILLITFGYHLTATTYIGWVYLTCNLFFCKTTSWSGPLNTVWHASYCSSHLVIFSLLHIKLYNYWQPAFGCILPATCFSVKPPHGLDHSIQSDMHHTAHHIWLSSHCHNLYWLGYLTCNLFFCKTTSWSGPLNTVWHASYCSSHLVIFSLLHIKLYNYWQPACGCTLPVTYISVKLLHGLDHSIQSDMHHIAHHIWLYSHCYISSYIIIGNQHVGVPYL